MDISFSISNAPSVTQNIAVLAYEADANGNPVGGIAAQVQFTPPHNNPRNVTFTNLNPVPYIVNIYETPGLPATGQLRFSFIYRPEFTDYKIKVQFLNMVGGNDTYTVPDNSWNGFTATTIDRRGIGILKPLRTGETPDGTQELMVWDGDNDSPKGFKLLTANDSFGDGELFVVTLFSSLTSRLPIYNIAKVIYAERIITNDAAVTVADSNKSIRLQGASGVGAFTVSLPSISTLTPFSCFLPFFSDGGEHINVSIQAAGSDPIYIANPFASTPQTQQYRSIVHLGQSEQFVIHNNATGWVVFSNNTGILTVGTEIESRDKDMVNRVFADGAVLLRNVYRRLWEWVQGLETGAIITSAQWNATDNSGKGKYHSGDGSTNFGIPQLYSVGFARAVQTGAAAYKPDTIINHLHAMATANETGAATPLESISGNGKKIFVRVKSDGNNSNYDIRGRQRQVGSSIVEPDLGQTSSPYVLENGVYVNKYFDTNGTPKTGAPTETAPKHYGIYKMICI